MKQGKLTYAVVFRVFLNARLNQVILYGGHSIAPKTTSANAASASP